LIFFVSLALEEAMKIISFNVNGVRACAKKVLLTWLQEEEPDILCLQETKARPEVLGPELLTDHGYHCVWASAEKKGYSGTSTWSREAPDEVQVGLGIERFDREGRTVVTTHGPLTVFNGYFPNGQNDHGRVPYKLDYTAAVLDAAELARAQEQLVVVCGDLNTAHHPIDLARPKANVKTTGFLPIERAALDTWIESGWVDSFRHMHPDEPDHYSWWSFRSGARARNVGWRIDYHMISAETLPHLKRAWILKDVLGSDHCPVGIELTLDTSSL